MRLRKLVLVLPFVLGGCGYNTIQTMDERAKSAQQQIAVQLQRRSELVPNLVSTVKGFAAQEAEVFETVVKARAGLGGAIAGGNVTEMANANQQLSGALGRLIAVAEAYPTLKSDQNFLRLQDELVGTENRVGQARTDYNNSAQEYNAYIRRFPAVLTAKVIGAKPRDYFDVTDAAARVAPKVDFGKKPD